MKIEEELTKMSEGKILNIFYELLSLFNNLIQNEFDLKIKNDEKSFDDIIKYLEIKSYNYPKLKEIKNYLKNILSINYLLLFYEKVKNKAFNKLTPDLKQKIENEKFYMDINIQNEIEECLNKNKIIKKDILKTAMIKYILRYIIKEEKFLFNFNDLKKKDVWDISIFNTKDFNSDFEKLVGLDSKGNNGNNLVVKYFYLLIYEIDMNGNNFNNNNNNVGDNSDSDDENPDD